MACPQRVWKPPVLTHIAANPGFSGAGPPRAKKAGGWWVLGVRIDEPRYTHFRGALAGAGSSLPGCVELPIHFLRAGVPACDRAERIYVDFGVSGKARKRYLTASGRAPERRQPASNARRSSFGYVPITSSKNGVDRWLARRALRPSARGRDGRMSGKSELPTGRNHKTTSIEHGERLLGGERDSDTVPERTF